MLWPRVFAFDPPNAEVTNKDHCPGNAVRIAERPNLLWLQVQTDQGLAGLDETFFMAATVEA